MRNPPGTAIAFLIPLLAFASPAGAVTSRDLMRASVLQQHGVRALEAGNTKKAQRYLTEAVDLLPFYPEAHLGLGHIAMRDMRFEDALSEYGQALDGYRRLGESLNDLQAIRYRDAQDQISDLRDQILNLLITNSKASPPGLDRAITRLRDSIRRLETVEPPRGSLAPEPPGHVHFFLGNALFRLNRIEDAKRAWETCTLQSPEFPYVYNNLAVVYVKQGRMDDARRSLERAEQLGFDVNPDFKNSLGLKAEPVVGGEFGSRR